MFWKSHHPHIADNNLLLKLLSYTTEVSVCNGLFKMYYFYLGSLVIAHRTNGDNADNEETHLEKSSPIHPRVHNPITVR